MASAIYPRPDTSSAQPPDIDRIAIILLKIVAQRPKAEHGAFYRPSRQPERKLTAQDAN
jgi:hypothetical protein